MSITLCIVVIGSLREWGGRKKKEEKEREPFTNPFRNGRKKEGKKKREGEGFPLAASSLWSGLIGHKREGRKRRGGEGDLQ